MRTEGAAAGLRSDARRNRKLLVEAAGEVLREHGLDASLDLIARRAGVGNATLYRHFATREKLYEAVFAELGGRFDAIEERVRGIDDGWTALATYLEEVCGFFAADQGFADLMAQGMPRSGELNEMRVRAERLVRGLLERAQRQGTVRPDVEVTDVGILICALQRVVPAAEAVATGSWRRHLTLMLDGLRAEGASALPAPALTLEQMDGIGERLGHHHPPPRRGPARMC